MDKKTTGRWIEVFTTNEEAEAAIITGLLEGEGISCRVESGRVSQIPVTFGGMGEFKVLVQTDDFDKAGKVLEAARAEEEEEP
jgi:hypothetical protein